VTALEKSSLAWGADPNKPNEEGVLIWDISDPINPRQLSHWKAGAAGTQRRIGQTRRASSSGTPRIRSTPASSRTGRRGRAGRTAIHIRAASTSIYQRARRDSVRTFW